MMNGAQFDNTRFFLIPLTPLHIGGGEEAMLTPEDFRLSSNGYLERVDLRRMLLSTPDAAARVRSAGQNLLLTLELLRGQASPDDVIERIAISPTARDFLRGAFREAKAANKWRSGQVNAFQRAGGRPILPGTSLKGALRTAWLEKCSQGLHIDPSRETRARHERLVREAFALASGKRATDTDPMRDVTVSDATLPDNATMVDQMESWKETGGGRYGYASNTSGRESRGQSFKMHWERTRSIADGGEPPVIEVQIGVRARDVVAGRHVKRDHAPTRSPGSLGELLRALNDHHAPLWERELEKYFPGDEGQRLHAAFSLLGGLRFDAESDPDAALVRIGRGGHAESKSVAGFREVQRPQVKGPGRRAKEGNTRHVVKLDDGHPAPMGWAVLVRADRWQPPARWLSTSGGGAARGPRAAAPGSVPQTARTGAPSQAVVPAGIRWRKGQRVLLTDGEEAVLLEDVLVGSTEVQVRFDDASNEPVKVSEIKGPAT